MDPAFDWEGDKKPDIAYHKTIIYETHVKGISMQHPGVQDRFRGTFAALKNQELLQHIRSLGVTSIELLPVHGFVDDHYLLEKGLKNYWGYNSIAFFAWAFTIILIITIMAVAFTA